MRYKAEQIAAEADFPNEKWLVSRDLGKRFLRVLEDKLQALPENEILLLDFKDISLLEFSFADEVIAALCVKIAMGDYIDKYLILENLSETAIENLHWAIKTRADREKTSLRNLVMPTINEGKISLLGNLEGHLKPVWDYVIGNTEITTRDLAETLGMEINTASTKLKTLYDRRLLKRQEVKTDIGKQFVYSKI